MTILYVILTCRAYSETRQKWQRESWLNGVDYVYLDDTSHDRFADRYEAFFSGYNGTHDWLFFCDDDTFVFTHKLEEFLSAYSSAQPLQIGFAMSDFEIAGHGVKTTLCSGGAGIAVSKKLISDIKAYVGIGDVVKNPESDTTLAAWCKLSCDGFVTVAANRWFCPTHPRWHNVKQDCITYHYCEECDFRILKERAK